MNALGGDIDRLLLFHALAADGGLERDFDGALFDQVVMGRNENLRIVAVGEGQRQFQFAEQLFLDGQLGAVFASQGFARDALGKQLPGGRTLRQRKRDRGFALFVRHHGRIPVAGLLRPHIGQ